MLKTLFVILLISLMAIFISCSEKSTKKLSINKNSSAEVEQLLTFLYEIEGKFTLSGHHNYKHSPVEFSDSVKMITGSRPVIWGSDFSFGYRSQFHVDSTRQVMIDTAISMHEKGHIITLMWHACFPSNSDTCSSETIWIWDDIIKQNEWDDLTNENSELNKLWKKQMDNVAGYLKQLAAKNIPVLWRPFHEMNGVWFWWCNHPGENGVIKLWKYMYNYFTHTHKLNNLVWVWNANAPRDIEGDEAYPYIDYFPGIEYVDVLAADVYRNDYKQSHHDQLLDLGKGKPIALGEVGQMPSNQVLEDQNKWTWFMGWANWLNKANDPDSVRALYSSPRTITLDQVSLNNGTYRINEMSD